MQLVGSVFKHTMLSGDGMIGRGQDLAIDIVGELW